MDQYFSICSREWWDVDSLIDCFCQLCPENAHSHTTKSRCLFVLCLGIREKLLLLLQPLHWHCVKCVIHHERDVCEEKNHIYVARNSNNRMISSGDLYCCLLPQCEALRTCRSGFPIATLLKTIFVFKSTSEQNSNIGLSHFVQN